MIRRRSARKRPSSIGKAPLAPRGTSACASRRKEARRRRNGTRRGRESRAPPGRGARLWRRGTRTSSRGERGDGESAETHLIIARFRHLAPALNKTLVPLTHSLLPPLSIRPLCASIGRDGTARSMARLIGAVRNYIALRASRRVGALPAAVRRRISRRPYPSCGVKTVGSRTTLRTSRTHRRTILGERTSRTLTRARARADETRCVTRDIALPISDETAAHSQPRTTARADE